jgi:diguanylate cyclase (GGDEF)-like protein
VARYGGEEFTIILPDTGAKGAKVLSQRLRRGIEQTTFDNSGQDVSVTISIGISSTDMEGLEQSRASLIECSDQALYKAKENGRNRVELGSV